ncbi:putative ABC transporter substrate-binding lipoprotein YvrC [Robertmurraya siralis]|uniref:ABC transporter substrate-binding lipoprotein YvrC n=1 Tax=Robertmurraya siralis TaxID=77777 RepID=A0A920BVF4_9BACI|nr:ABC transporter substrate-binding protein [Robertmurraya siralis]PAE19818.1 ABC transporter substrate-binding protein [Bacillus sp. 7504-2]GIN63486.1 putative ABC transporter substrate-binding lipoprotein YvrC [Robertmurraya siralis]
MKKWYSILLLLMLSIGILAGCGQSEKPAEENNAVEETEGSTENANEEAFPVTITDAIGEEVVIESKPEKIVSLIPSNTEIAFALGLGNEIVGVSEHDNFPEEVFEKEIIGGMEMNVEKIISLAPNLVLAHASNAHNSTEGLQQLRDAGITVLVVNDAATINEIYESIEMIGTATGEQEKAEEIVNNMKTKIAEIEEKAAEISEPKSVIVEVSPAPDIFVVGKNTFMDEMLTLIHAENGAGDLEGWVNLDEEAVIERNPDVIITTYGYYTENAVDLLLSREGWQDVAAVKNKQVYDVHSDLVTRSGPRLAEGLEELAKAIYPEVFE